MVRRSRSLALSVSVLVVVLALPVPIVHVAADGGTYSKTLSPLGGTRVSLSYVHSVEKTVVQEEYDVRPSGVVMTAMAWQSFGAGLPEEYDEVADGWYVKHMRTPVAQPLIYWFVPFNDVSLDVGPDRVFEGPDRDSQMVLSVRYLPLVVSAVEMIRSSELPL